MPSGFAQVSPLLQVNNSFYLTNSCLSSGLSLDGTSFLDPSDCMLPRDLEVGPHHVFPLDYVLEIFNRSQLISPIKSMLDMLTSFMAGNLRGAETFCCPLS